MIIEKQIPRVIIASRDPFPEVNGKGIELLRQAGVEVTLGVLEQEARFLNRRFFTFHTQHRPYIILKWAQTQDGFLAREDYTSQWISSPYSRLLSHHWRSEEGAILVGTNTALYDNPQLTARDMGSRNPLRILVDRLGRVPASHHLLDGAPTWVFTQTPGQDRENLRYITVNFDERPLAQQICDYLYAEKVQSLIIEGGSQLLEHFLRHGLWDEARVIQGQSSFGAGIPAPKLALSADESYELGKDSLQVYYRR